MSHNVSQCLTGENDSADNLPGLDERQLLAIELILAGKPDTQVAKSVGVNRRTVCRWRYEHEPFITELNRRRREWWGGVANRFRALLEPAVDVLGGQLTGDCPRLRFRAAATLLKLADVKAMLVEERNEF